VAHWKYRTPKIAKNRHLGTIAQLCWAVSSQQRHISTILKNLLSISTSSTCPHNMVNFGTLTAEICWRVLGTPANFNRFRLLEVLLHGTTVVGVSQTLRRWTEGATYIQQGGHHVGHWPTFYFTLCCWQQQQQQPFYGPLSGTTQVRWYQKKHSPTHHPDHNPIFVSFFHLPRSTLSITSIRAMRV